jgi:methylmalonyl-CoA/ethylmalonyl-CoA epimerase
MLQGLTFHHIGLACRDLAVDRRDHEFLGYVAEGDVFEDPLQRIRGLFMTLGGMRIELLQALDEASPLRSFLRRGVKIYHECFLCPDFDRSLAALQLHRARLAGEPKPAIAFQNRRIAFVLLPSQTLIELIESGE